METKDKYPLGVKDPQWQSLCLFITKMDKQMASFKETLFKELPEYIGKDFSNPESFTDEEVWQIYELLDKEIN